MTTFKTTTSKTNGRFSTHCAWNQVASSFHNNFKPAFRRTVRNVTPTAPVQMAVDVSGNYPGVVGDHAVIVATATSTINNQTVRIGLTQTNMSQFEDRESVATWLVLANQS
jgi:hypothetical protein